MIGGSVVSAVVPTGVLGRKESGVLGVVSSSLVFRILLFIATALPKLGILVALCWLLILVSAFAASSHLLLAAVLCGATTLLSPCGNLLFSSLVPHNAVVLDLVYF